MKDAILKGAMITGIINGIINGGIQYFFLKDMDSIPISVDSISNGDVTVLGTAVMLAITLAMILTLVAYFGIKEKKAPFFPTTLWLTIKHGFFTFGVLTSLAVLWQRYMGTVEVSLTAALLIIGIIAGIVSGIVNYLTLKESILIIELEN
ncbi:hypothetical protein Aeqsu_0776 [Aequorivita sublithincola DSM 14238]|uniref:Permease n=1 Tax=Aequorivita sublithincola (strain DSM 14238 / LMG 21431 / ACAM 643 / 9-3) TaxID=746697 RepID=I3YTG5_AEQSU|nr:hypothetical protein [Aequorivita sublithincola]AFL80283.1 hypothetical protein Aeqsu_0776 [Aequorivita sublithincola DSM 14238]